MAAERRVWLRRVGCIVGLLVGVAILTFTTDAAERLPVLLVYGFQPIPGFRAIRLWEAMAECLSGSDIVEIETFQIEPGHSLFFLGAASDGARDVYISDYALAYEPTTRNLCFYADRLSDEIAWIVEQAGVERIDIVGHSMGGLVARAYIESSDFAEVLGSADVPDYGLSYGGEVRVLITTATPHHGMSLGSLSQYFNTLTRQLSPGSDVLAMLNRDEVIDGRLTALHPDVQYVSMAGQTCFGCGLRLDESVCLRDCVTAGIAWQGSDLVTLMASAYLPDARNIACIGMDHVDMRIGPLICSTVTDLLDGRPVPDVIYGDPNLQTAAAASE